MRQGEKEVEEFFYHVKDEVKLVSVQNHRNPGVEITRDKMGVTRDSQVLKER